MVRCTRALRLTLQPSRRAVLRSPTAVAATSTNACLNAAISAGVPTLTRSQGAGPDSRMSTPRSSRPCQTACRSANSPNNTKLASESATENPCARSQSTVSSRPAAGRSPAPATRRRAPTPHWRRPGSPSRGDRAAARCAPRRRSARLRPGTRRVRRRRRTPCSSCGSPPGSSTDRAAPTPSEYPDAGTRHTPRQRRRARHVRQPRREQLGRCLVAARYRSDCSAKSAT